MMFTFRFLHSPIFRVCHALKLIYLKSSEPGDNFSRLQNQDRTFQAREKCFYVTRAEFSTSHVMQFSNLAGNGIIVVSGFKISNLRERDLNPRKIPQIQDSDLVFKGPSGY